MLNPNAKTFVPHIFISKNFNTHDELCELYELCDIMRGSIQLFSYFKCFCVALSLCLYTCICTPFLQAGSMYDNIYTEVTHTNDNSSYLSNVYFNDEPSSLEFTIVNTLENVEANINDECDPLNTLKCLRISNVIRFIVGHLNINSLRNKFESLKLIMKGNIDILVITESKLDDYFPASQFIIDGYAPPFRVDKNKNSGGVIIYVRDDLPSRELKGHPTITNFEYIFFEINLKKIKMVSFWWL